MSSYSETIQTAIEAISTLSEERLLGVVTQKKKILLCSSDDKRLGLAENPNFISNHIGLYGESSGGKQWLCTRLCENPEDIRQSFISYMKNLLEVIEVASELGYSQDRFSSFYRVSYEHMHFYLIDRKFTISLDEGYAVGTYHYIDRLSFRKQLLDFERRHLKLDGVPLLSQSLRDAIVKEETV